MSMASRLKRVAEILAPEEQWQADLRREQQLEQGGFDGDDEVPLMLGEIEDEQAWQDEKSIVDEHGRFCGRRWTGDAFDPANPMHARAAANDVEGGGQPQMWEDEE